MWQAVRFLHVVAVAFFVGGQLVLAAAVVPARIERSGLRAIARRFGAGTLVAAVVLVATGAAMASHYHLWGDAKLNLKLALAVVVALLLIWHTRRPELHVLEGVVFVLSLVIVWLGLALAHGSG